MNQEDINKMKNRIFNLEKEVEKQKQTIAFLESQSGKIVDDSDISHEALKCIGKGLTSDVSFKYAIQWYRDQSNNK